jgi:tetratricopeptide (TPR) repeat protein
MSGDEGYRAVLADCERALGRPEVALRLVSEALGAAPDLAEMSELRLVEAGARRDLGEQAAARLVLEAALTEGAPGTRLDPTTLDSADEGRLRLASAYADLLADEGEAAQSVEWLTAIAAADPDDAVGALARLGIEFTDEEDDDDDEDDAVDESQVDGDAGAVADERSADVESPEALKAVALEDDEQEPDQAEYLPDPVGFDAEVAAEVAELLGESEPPVAPADGPSGTGD